MTTLPSADGPAGDAPGCRGSAAAGGQPGWPGWPGCGWAQLQAQADGTLVVTDDYLRLWLQRPELAPVPESCDSERALHAALLAEPRRGVSAERLARLQDADARENWSLLLRLRQCLLDAGSVQGAYRSLFWPGSAVDLPPLFLDLLAAAIVRGLLQRPPAPAAGDDAGGLDIFEARAGELFFRPQRISRHDGRLLAGDRATLDQLHDTAGLGELGRLLMQAQVVPKALQLAVLARDTAADAAARYWHSAAQGHHPLLLDLSHDAHEFVQDVGSHGLQFRLHNPRSALSALARLLERWVQQLLGVRVHIEPRSRIADTRWRWHLGLDADSTALLNALYEGREPEPGLHERLVSLFELRFHDPAEQQPALAGCPVYLGLAHAADGVLRLKPQNLRLNLPLARPQQAWQ